MKYSEIKCRDMNCDECPLAAHICGEMQESTLDYTLGKIAEFYSKRLINRVDQEYKPGQAKEYKALSDIELKKKEFIGGKR